MIITWLGVGAIRKEFTIGNGIGTAVLALLGEGGGLHCGVDGTLGFVCQLCFQLVGGLSVARRTLYLTVRPGRHASLVDLLGS